MFSGNYNPDVLSCIANLSSDEVFTPPQVAHPMHDAITEGHRPEEERILHLHLSHAPARFGAMLPAVRRVRPMLPQARRRPPGARAGYSYAEDWAARDRSPSSVIATEGTRHGGGVRLHDGGPFSVARQLHYMLKTAVLWDRCRVGIENF